MSGRKGFNSESGLIARLNRDKKELQDKISGLRMDKCALRDRIDYLENELIAAQNSQFQCCECDILEKIHMKFPHLYSHILCAGKNSSCENEHQYRYSDKQKVFYLQYSSFGEDNYNHLYLDFGFPAFRTMQRFKSKCLNEMRLSPDIFDGSLIGITKIFESCWKSDETEDNRCVLAIDAASVTASVVAHKDGTVTGLNRYERIDEAARSALKEGIDAFISFVDMNKEDICKYYFVLFINPLSPWRKPFPILSLKTSSGQANDATVCFVNELIGNIRNYCPFINIIGIAFDGDTGWLHKLNPLIERIPILSPPLKIVEGLEPIVVENLLQLNYPLSSISDDLEDLLPFEDLLHLLKCARYRIIKDDSFHSWPSIEEPDVLVEELHSCGIPKYVLDKSQTKKMEDLYPLMMFNFRILQKIRETKRELIPIFAPLTYLEESVFNLELTRTQRLDFLSRAFSLMLIYKNETHLPNVRKSSCVFDSIFINKFLTLCISLNTIIVNPLAVHLGALGTHWLEHFFGKIRRICKRNDSIDRVDIAFMDILIQKLLNNKFHQEIHEYHRKSRVSDSGCVLPPQEDHINAATIFQSMLHAYILIRESNHQITNQYLLDLFTYHDQLIDDLLILENGDFVSFIEYIYHSTSTLQLKMQGGGGFTSANRLFTGEELIHYID